jgi:hypothetical protein
MSISRSPDGGPYSSWSIFSTVLMAHPGLVSTDEANCSPLINNVAENRFFASSFTTIFTEELYHPNKRKTDQAIIDENIMMPDTDPSLFGASALKTYIILLDSESRKRIMVTIINAVMRISYPIL